MNYPLLAMHTVAGIKLHNIKYKYFFFKNGEKLNWFICFQIFWIF